MQNRQFKANKDTKRSAFKQYNLPAKNHDGLAHTNGFIVRLRGLPWQATENDILDFFAGLTVRPNGIHITLNNHGRPTGEAYVEFLSEKDCNFALERHKQNMGHRYVEVFRSSSVEMNKFVSRRTATTEAHPKKRSHKINNPNMQSSEVNVVRMRGLPFNATEVDIADFFAGFDIIDNGLYIIRGADGRATGEAFVEFASEEQARQSLRRHNERMGNRYIELFRSNKTEMLNVLAQYGMRPAKREFYSGQQFSFPNARIDPLMEGVVGTTPTYQNVTELGIINNINPSTTMDWISQDSSSSTDWWARQMHDPQSTVRLRGLPYSCTPQDLHQFFLGYDFIRDSLNFGATPDGRASGEAWITFSTPDEAQRAIQEKNRQHIGNRYIELFPL